MAIELSIETVENRVIASVTGEIEEQCSNTSDLTLSKGDIETALKKLYDGDYKNFYLTGYTKTFTALSEDVEIVRERVEPLIIDHEILSNTTGRETGTFISNLTHTVTNTVAVTWSSEKQMTKGFEIGCDLKIGGSTHMNFISTSGTDATKTKSLTVGATRGVSVTLAPGREAKVNLQVNRRVLTLRVPFKVKIGGDVVGCYGSNHTKTFDMKDVLEAAGRRSSCTTTATVEIDCYTDSKIELTDV